MSVTIRPKLVAGRREPHAGVKHRWRPIGAHVLHVGYRKNDHFAVKRKDKKEVREVFVCEHEGCKEVYVKIRFIEQVVYARKWVECSR